MKLVEVFEFNDPGYAKVFSFKEWRVAFLNYIEHLKIDKIDHVECHHQTDEVFVLLEGSCQLIIFDNNKFEIVELEKNKIYNVRQGVFHSHVLSVDSKVLVIEQEDTNDINSTRIYLTNEQREEMINVWRNYNGI